jgi:hypothetical protein
MGEYADEAVEYHMRLRGVFGPYSGIRDCAYHWYGTPKASEPEWDTPEFFARDRDGNPNVYCRRCQIGAVLRNGEDIYRRADLRTKMIWVCTQCGDRVGCHPHTNDPLGYLADAPTRAARSRAHGCFDPIWRNGHMTRGAAYQALCDWMQIDPQLCHMGMMNVEQLEQVVEFVKQRYPEHGPKKLDNIANFKF